MNDKVSNKNERVSKGPRARLKGSGSRCTALTISKPLSLAALPVAVSSCARRVFEEGQEGQMAAWRRRQPPLPPTTGVRAGTPAVAGLAACGATNMSPATAPVCKAGQPPMTPKQPPTP